MAALKTRRNKHGDITSYRVTWPLGGGRDGEWQNERFDPDQETRAKDFKSKVEEAGHQWPPNWLPGIGEVEPAVYAKALAAANAVASPGAMAPATGATARPPVHTVRSFAKLWLSSLSGVEDYTVKRYRRILELHVFPWFGNAAIDDTQAISTFTIGAWIRQLERGTEPGADEDSPATRDRLKPKSIRNVHGVLFPLIQAAVDADPPLRGRNPCEHTVLPKAGSTAAPRAGRDDEDVDEEFAEDLSDDEMVFLTPEEFHTIHALLPADAQDLAEFMVGTGLRYSEATALQVRDFDLFGEVPSVMVQRAWKRVGNGTWRLGPPKTEKSKRRISLTAEQVQLIAPLVAGKTGKQYVLVKANGARWGHSTFYTHRWRPAVYKAVRCPSCRARDEFEGITRRGLRYLKKKHIVWCGCPGALEKVPRIHDLRHSHVAWLLAAKIPLPVMQRRLGHASIQVTIDRYGHLLPELDAELVEALGAIMVRSGPPSRNREWALEGVGG